MPKPADEPALDAPRGPGGQLKQARLKSKLDVEEVATRLRLNVRTIERIEADDYEHLPAPTFVRGYLRGYARLLNLAPEPIAAAYDSNHFGPPPLVPDISNTAQVKSTDFPVRLVTYLIASAIVALVVIWWQNQAFSPPSLSLGDWSSREPTDAAAAEPGEAVPTKSGAVETPPDANPMPSSGPSTLPLEVDGPSRFGPSYRGPPIELATTPVEFPAPAIVLARSTGLDSTLDEPSSSGPPVETADNVPRPLSPRPVSDSATAASLEPSNQDGRLKIVLRHDSWVEIYSRDDSRLYYDLAKAGEVIDVAGVTPFRVLLGYAEQAEVEFNGKPFDYSANLDRGMARFTLSLPAASPFKANASDAEPTPSIADRQVFLPQSQPR